MMVRRLRKVNDHSSIPERVSMAVPVDSPPPNPPPQGGRARWLASVHQYSLRAELLSPPPLWGRARVGGEITSVSGSRLGRLQEYEAVRPKSRRGVTIIEVIVLMTGVAAMLGLSVILLQLLMKLDADSRSRFDAAASLARLARQFRHDVHAAGSVRLVEQPASKAAVLRIDSGPDRAIDYRVKGEDRIVRVETGKGTEVRRESFLVPRSSSIRLSIDGEDGASSPP